jgi:radical SAM-linked protein
LRGDNGFPVRLRFTKRGPVRFISHRDVARALERAFRIAELPLAFSSGFSPHPRISFGPALALGYESTAEYLDLVLTREIDEQQLADEVSDGLPSGMDVTGAIALADRAPSLQESISALTYRVTLDGAPRDAVAGAVVEFSARPHVEVPVSRKGEVATEDIRSAVHVIELADVDGPEIVVEIATRPRTLRVADVVNGLRAVTADAALLAEQRVVRTHQWIERGGARHEPLDVDRRSAAPQGAEPRALEACA